MTKRLTTEEFLNKAKEVHGDRFDYTKVNYINNDTKVCIICKKHGDFWQTPHSHLSSRGCSKCGYNNVSQSKLSNTKEFIEKARLIHGDKYDYSKVEYINNRTKVCIICPKHGEFYQTPDNHISKKQTCPKCANLLLSINNKYTKEEFINKAKAIHGDKYDYSKVEYKGIKTKVCIICPTHGEFLQTPDSHFRSGCPKCGNQISIGEDEIYNHIKNTTSLAIIQRNRSVLKRLELDIYVPSLNMAIEYNGLYWHSDLFQKDELYHLNKLKSCNKHNIHLIHIFEDDYTNHKNIIINEIDKLFLNHNIYDYTIVTINEKEAEIFLNENSIKGYNEHTKINVGLYNTSNKLLGVMSFDNDNNITTFASIQYRNIEEAILSFYIQNYNPKVINATIDRGWFTNEQNNCFTKLGFYPTSIIKPQFKLFNQSLNRYHRFTIDEMKRYDNLIFNKIWNCGQIEYTWSK